MAIPALSLRSINLPVSSRWSVFSRKGLPRMSDNEKVTFDGLFRCHRNLSIVSIFQHMSSGHQTTAPKPSLWVNPSLLGSGFILREPTVQIDLQTSRKGGPFRRLQQCVGTDRRSLIPGHQVHTQGPAEPCRSRATRSRKRSLFFMARPFLPLSKLRDSVRHANTLVRAKGAALSEMRRSCLPFLRAFQTKFRNIFISQYFH
jgi:hypothetical protein